MLMKQNLVSTSSNHNAELIAHHEATHECVWLRVVIEYIQSTSGFFFINDAPVTIHEDSVACIDLMKKGYIKGDNTMHITPKFFSHTNYKSIKRLKSRRRSNPKTT